VVTRPGIDIVVELIGGTGVARQVVEGAIANGKSVVTANKELIALDGLNIWRRATERGVSLKQVFDEGPGTYRVCLYSNFKTNQPLPPDAFTFKTDRQTEIINQ